MDKINEGPIDIRELINRIQQRSSTVKSHKSIYPWQKLALEVIQMTSCKKEENSSVFKAAKVDPRSFKIAMEDCKELNKPFINYFFKVYHILRKLPVNNSKNSNKNNMCTKDNN